MKLFGRRSASLLIALLIFCATSCLHPVNIFAETPYWPMVGYDKAHTGHNTAETSLYPPFPFEIVYPLGNGLGGLSSYEGTLFSTTETDTNRINAMDIATGEILWSVPIPGSGGGPSHTPAVWDTLVYGSGQHGDGLHCFNARTGEEVWFRSMGSLFEQHVTVDDGRVYVQARGDRLYCLDGLTGSVIWSRPSDDAVVPAIVGDTIFASLRSDSVTAFHKVTSGRLWAVPVPVHRSVLVAGDSLLYLKSSPTQIRALRLQDGSEKWSREFPGETVGEADKGCFAYADNILFVSMWEDSAGRGKIYALEGDTGNSIWDYTFNDTGAFAAVIANGVVYVGGWRDARIYAFNPSTGDTIATFPGLQNYYIVSDGKLIAGGGSNDVHILSMEPVGIEGGGRTEPPLPHTFTLKQNYPNPFNPSTTISFDIPEALSINKKVNLVVYDMRGRLVRTLIDTELEPGTHKIHWDGRDDQGESVASGIYMYRLKSGDETLTRKMTVMK